LAQQGHYAGALSRLLAYGADLLILTVVYAAALALLEFAISAATPWNVNLEQGHVLVLVGELLWGALYFGNSWVIFARSPGMTLLGLRIVQADGSSLDRHHAIVRLLAFPLGFLTLGIGFLGIVFGRTHQAIYDRIARTAVVYDWDAEAAKLRGLAARGARQREELSGRAREQPQEEQEDIQDIQKDPGGQGDRLVCPGVAQPVEVHDGVEAKDRKPGQRIDRVRGGYTNEDQHDAGGDEHQQQPEQRSV
jgi:uncharacterized RDD family membrane protein YckC